MKSVRQMRTVEVMPLLVLFVRGMLSILRDVAFDNLDSISLSRDHL